MDIRNIDLNLLPLLDALLRHRSVTLAARELDMSQSALSSGLARLRDLLGDALFVRTGRGLLPTPRATLLAEPVAAILKQVRDKVLASNKFDPSSSNRVFTICHSDVGSYVLWPRIVPAVTKLAPNVRLQLKVMAQPQIPAALENAAIDLAIGAYPELPDSLFQRRLFERKYVGIVRAGHPISSKRLTPALFASTPQLVVRLASGVQELVDKALGEQNLVRTATMEVPSYLMLPPLLEAGDYLAVIPGQLADAFARHGHYKSLKLPVDLPASTIKLHWHRRFHDDPGNIWLRGIIWRLFGR
jgi:DNA-binding transcriptional LysR family regulator